MALDLTPLLAVAAFALMAVGAYLIGLHNGRNDTE